MGRPCSLLPEQAPIASQEQVSGFCEPGELEGLGEEEGKYLFQSCQCSKALDQLLSWDVVLLGIKM